MFTHTLESLEEFEDYIKQLEETVGLKTETYKEVMTAISKERTKLKNLAISGVDKAERTFCDHPLENRYMVADDERIFCDKCDSRIV